MGQALRISGNRKEKLELGESVKKTLLEILLQSRRQVGQALRISGNRKEKLELGVGQKNSS